MHSVHGANNGERRVLEIPAINDEAGDAIRVDLIRAGIDLGTERGDGGLAGGVGLGGDLAGLGAQFDAIAGAFEARVRGCALRGDGGRR